MDRHNHDPRPEAGLLPHGPTGEILPYRNDAPETSRLAAEAAAPTARRVRSNVLAAIRAAGELGATNDDVHRATGYPPQSVTPRCKELRKAGLVIDSGRKRHTQWGKPAIVWVAAEHAPEGKGVGHGGC